MGEKSKNDNIDSEKIAKLIRGGNFPMAHVYPQAMRATRDCIGNAHLKWAFAEATILYMRESEKAKRYVARMARKHGKGGAISILSHKLGRAEYAIKLGYNWIP